MYSFKSDVITEQRFIFSRKFSRQNQFAVVQIESFQTKRVWNVNVVI